MLMQLLSFLPHVLISIWAVLYCRVPSLSSSVKARAGFLERSVYRPSWWNRLLVRNTFKGTMALGVCFTVRLCLKRYGNLSLSVVCAPKNLVLES